MPYALTYVHFKCLVSFCFQWIQCVLSICEIFCWDVKKTLNWLVKAVEDLHCKATKMQQIQGRIHG